MSEINIQGEYTDARVFTDDVDEKCIDQIQEMVDHEAFRNSVRLMPDAHPGAGTVIGFTMKMGDRVCPNTVGVDIGCGMTAVKLGYVIAYDKMNNELLYDIDKRIRERVPMGRNNFGDVPAEQSYHIVDDFPWDLCENKLGSLNYNMDMKIPDPGYGKEYFLDVCDKVGYSTTDAINSVGTLGGGNHFIEISKSDVTGDYWVVVHSGSRGIGMAIAQYWQKKASKYRDERAEYIREQLGHYPPWSYKFDLDDPSDEELLQWVQGGMGEDWKDTDAIREKFDGEDIGHLINILRSLGKYAQEQGQTDDLDYLEDDERIGYLQDMIFAQTYAAESRLKMAKTVADILGADPKDTIVSTHNYIDFDDCVIRKGATRVHKGERGIIPFNMRDGAIIVRGKGNEEWNKSTPHGAGRRGSRRWAFDEFTLEEFEKEMDGIFSTSVTDDTVDEAPMAYKSSDTVLERIDETAKVEERLIPVHNIKAEE